MNKRTNHNIENPTSVEEVDVVTPKDLIGAFRLPKRFRDNGVTANVLSSLDHTPAAVSREDRILIEQIMSVSGFETNQPVIDFCETGKERGLADKLASAVSRISCRPDDNPFGFRLQLTIDPEIVAKSIGNFPETHVDKTLRSVSTDKPKVFSFELAQQLGHSLRMKSLRGAFEERGIGSIEFAIPNPDNLKLLKQDFDQGATLPWRQLFEPGYCLNSSLVFPMNPQHPDYAKTVVLTALLNRHIIALTCSALANGHDVILVNDARHEGPALFKAISDWVCENKPPGSLHTFHLSYVVLDPVSSILPPSMADQVKKAERLLRKRAEELFPNIQVADGVNFMIWKMLAQLFLHQETGGKNLNTSHHVLYQTSFSHQQLSLEMIPEELKPWFQYKAIIPIPEVAATAKEKNTQVRTIAITLGTSGHSEVGKIIAQAIKTAKSHPELRVNLIGKGTERDSVLSLTDDIPQNVQCCGILSKEEHDGLLSSADTIVIKTTRNNRRAITPAVLSDQGVILLPPDVPQEIPDDISLFFLSYLRETLVEHALDLATALKVLEDKGIRNTKDLLWRPDDDLFSLATRSRQSVMNRSGELITPDTLAKMIITVINSLKEA